MTKYKFDIRRGHYYPINEGTEPNANVDGVSNTDNANNANANATDANASATELNNADVAQLNKDKQTKLDNAEKQISDKRDNITQLEKKLADEKVKDTRTQQSLNNIQKEILQAKQDLAQKIFDKAKIEYDETKKILAFQKGLMESRRMFMMPEKYMAINESNIQNAKVYVDGLIENSSEDIIQGLCDFKRVFKTSELIYGKDDKGYFAVCVDQEDFQKMSNALEEAGFMKEEILAHTLPQIFDRSGMI